MSESWEEDKEWQEFVDHTRKETIKKMAESSFVMTISPDDKDEFDIKIAVETGLAILMNKPIISIVSGGRSIPPGLARVSHAIIEVDDLDTEAGRLELVRKLDPILSQFEAGAGNDDE